MPNKAYMLKAIALAKKGRFSAKPNPSVGCVLVKGDRVIGTGFHERSGEAHAEIRALSNARANGFDPKGAEVYVTLEPCSSPGRTGACTSALIDAKVAMAHIATLDANPAHHGQSLKLLEQSGIVCTLGLCAKEAEALNLGFSHRMQKSRPRIVAKVAMSMDGNVAWKGGNSKWITGDKARQDAHSLRGKSCAILTGIGTILKDNPTLNARPKTRSRIKQPDLFIVDSTLQTPPDAKVFAEPSRKVTFFCLRDSLPSDRASALASQADLVPIPSGKSGLSLSACLLSFGAYNQVMVEAGPKLTNALLRQRLVDDLIVYVAPKMLGEHGIKAFCYEDFAYPLHEKGRFSHTKKLGEDLRLTLSLSD